MARATASPDIVGMILTGSHTRGIATAHSDFDFILVSTEHADGWQRGVRSAELTWWSGPWRPSPTAIHVPRPAGAADRLDCGDTRVTIRGVAGEYPATLHADLDGAATLAESHTDAAPPAERVGGTSVDHLFRMTSLDGETVYAEGRRIAVRIDLATLKPAAWTDHGRVLAATITKI